MVITMKKYLSVLLLLCLICASTANCSEQAAAQNGSGNPESQGTPAASVTIDVDLTLLSSTMVYAEVYNIMTNPDNYMGKTIKMKGPYYASYYEKTELYYHYVVVEDATACCQQGLEFIWKGEHKYPADYPEDKTKIEVTGVFGSYDELGKTYYYILVDDILILT